MTKLITCLWFDRGKVRESAEFSVSVFPDSRVGEGHTSAADNPSAKEGEELTVPGPGVHRPEWRAEFQAE